MKQLRNIDIFNIKYLLLFKPLVDMLWNISILNYFVMIYAFIIFIFEYKSLKIIIKKIDILIYLGIFLLILSYTNEIDLSTTRIFVKIMSSFLLFYLGRNTTEDPLEIIRFMRFGYLIAFIGDIIAILFNQGFIYWGKALTFTGFYFFKTDLGVALLWLVFLTLIDENMVKHHRLQVFILSSLSCFLIILSNSRMTLILFFLVILLSFLYFRELQGHKLLKINFRLLFLAFILVLSGIYIIRLFGKSSFFIDNGFITFEFEQLSDLYSAKNLQGRNAIWQYLLEKFNSSGQLSKIFGISLNSYVGQDVFFKGLSSHSIYIGILYSFGYFGLSLFLIYIYCLFYRLNKIENRKVFYVTLVSIVCLLVYGISVNTHEFVNYTWNFGLFSGLIFNNYRKI